MCSIVGSVRIVYSLKMESVFCSETLVFTYSVTQRHNQEFSYNLIIFQIEKMKAYMLCIISWI
jgi:hypothetical protein